MLIGEVARKTGIATSALRYYEREGLLPPPARAGNRRHYRPETLGRVRIIQLARAAGFSVAETRAFVGTECDTSIPSARWRVLAESKIRELDALIVRAKHMKELLDSSFRCGCSTIDDCAQLMSKQRGQQETRR